MASSGAENLGNRTGPFLLRFSATGLIYGNTQFLQRNKLFCHYLKKLSSEYFFNLVNRSKPLFSSFWAVLGSLVVSRIADWMFFESSIFKRSDPGQQYMVISPKPCSRTPSVVRLKSFPGIILTIRYLTAR